MKTIIQKRMTGWAICLLILCAGYHAQAQTGWIPMGPAESNQASLSGIEYMAMAVDTGGSPYVIFEDAGDSDKATVRKFSNGSWSTVGNPDFSPGSAHYCEIAIDPSGVPYVIYSDGANGYKPVVMKYNGSSWVAVGASSLYSGPGGDPSIAIDASGNVFISFEDTLGFVDAMEYSGGTWTQLGTGQGTGSEQYSSIRIDPFGTPYMTYVDYNVSAAPQVVKYSGGAWSPVGSIPSVGGTSGGISLAFDASGTPYLAYDDPSGSGGIIVLSYTGGGWAPLPSPSTTANIQSDNALSVDASGHLYVFTTGDNGVQATVQVYNGSSWSILGTADMGSYVQLGQIALSPAGTPYISWGYGNTNVVVMEYTAGAWANLGTQGITGGAALSASIVCDSAGTPYMAYLGGSYFSPSLPLQVLTYDGSSWSPLGSAVVNEGGSPTIALDRHGVPYVAYNDSLRAYLKNYSGGRWSAIGSPFLSAGIMGMKVSYSGTPYIAYQDTFDYTARIETYSGGSWSMVDTVGFNPQRIYSLSFDVDRHDHLYVAFYDSTNTSLQVLEYDGSSWTSLNPPSLNVSYVQLALDTAGVLYLLYDGATNGMLTYQGGTWTQLGSAGFAPTANSLSFTLSNSGKPYVAYSDYAHGNKETVVTYNGTNWINVGAPDFTLQDASTPSIAVSPFGTVYTVFSNGGVWGYEFYTLPDSTVWPGDADANHLVDNTDLLPLGLAYDSTGPVRTVQGIVWQGDVASDWRDSFTIYAPAVNYKNADCNGDGIVNADDTLAITTNFSLTHAKSSNLPGPWRSTIPGFYLSLSLDTVADGNMLTTTISLGNASQAVNNIYGLAFTFNYDPSVVDSNTTFSFFSSWLGTPANSINIYKNFGTTGTVKAAITGIDHLPRSGSGAIAAFGGEITTGNINGKDLSYYQNVMYISDITAIDQHGNAIALNAAIDTNYVAYTPNGISRISQTAKINIYPNPANSQVKITSGAEITEITISDILGNEVKTVSVNNKLNESMDISRLDPGVYIIHVATVSGTATAKLVVSR